MPYIGQQLTTAQPSYLIIDDISSSFNGSTTSFALQVNGSTPAPFPVAAQNCLISVGGVVQEPDSGGTNGFNLSGSNIVFSSAPSSGESFWGVVLAGADYVNVGAQFPDGSVSNPSISRPVSWFIDGLIGPRARSSECSRNHPSACRSKAVETSGSSTVSKKPKKPTRSS